MESEIKKSDEVANTYLSIFLPPPLPCSSEFNAGAVSAMGTQLVLVVHVPREGMGLLQLPTVATDLLTLGRCLHPQDTILSATCHLPHAILCTLPNAKNHTRAVDSPTN